MTKLKLLLKIIIFITTLTPKPSFATESQAIVDGLNFLFNSALKYSIAKKDIENSKAKPEPTPERKLSDPYFGKKVIVINVPIPNGGGATIPKYLFVDDK